MMTPEVNWFYVWGGIVVLIILGIGAYTYKEIARTKNKRNRRGTIDKNSVLAVLRAQADGALYGLLEAEYAEDRSAEAQDAGDEVAAATRTLMLWTAVLASATILMAYFAYFTLDAIRGQLTEMQTDSAIRRSELAATMRLEIDRRQNAGTWGITSLWMNIGKTNALNFMGWEDFKIFRTKEDYVMLTPAYILKTPPDKSKIWASNFTIIPNSPVSPYTKALPEQDAWDITYGKNTFALLWGYVEYTDIFGDFYTIWYCDFFNFTLVGQELCMNLPHAFAAECMRRTQERHK
jgi:hypothetical protein